MQKFKNIVFVFVVLSIWWISQIIFSVLYSPFQNWHLGIWSGSWTNTITITWFALQQFIDFKQSIPTEITTWWIYDYNSKCSFWAGNCISFWGQDFYSAFSWIDTIQYIGKDVDISKPSNITNKFNSINNLNPKRWYPYLFIQYIWPSKKNDSNNETTILTRKNTVKIGEEWINYQCDRNKINKISQLNYQEFLDAISNKKSEYRYPCKSDELAHALAFNYYHYMNDPIKSSLYYMVASFHDETPSITLSMPAIIQWREGNNKISAFLWYDKLQKHYKDLERKDLEDDKRKKTEFQVDVAIERMVSELSLHILTQASELSAQQEDAESCRQSVSCLKEKKYITTILNNIKNNCSKDRISCEILSIGQQSWRIKDSGSLQYPINGTATYAWRAEKWLRWVKVK